MIDSILNNVLIQEIILLAKPALFNAYFALASIPIGFPFAVLLALGKYSTKKWLSIPARTFIYAFRGSPLFIQFFMFYALMLSLNKVLWKPWGVDEWILHPLFIGPFVLILNTGAYAAEIFYGALRTIPKGEVEAAKAMGMSKSQVFRTVTWPNMLRLSWPAYTNEMVFLFHSTTLVYFTLPVINEQKDLMNKAGELFEKDYNIYLHFGVAGLYFVIASLIIFYLSELYRRRLNRHLSLNG